MKNDYQKLYRDSIMEVRRDNEGLVASMPSVAKTEAQKELAKKHGTPREFAQACVNAIGEITCLEAHEAISRYQKKWNAAGRR